MGLEQKKIKITGNSLIDSNKKFKKNSPEAFLVDFMEGGRFYEVLTSGSTGKPKKIKIKKEFMIASAEKTIGFLGLEEGDKALLCLPMDKIAGIMMCVRWLVGSLDIYPVEPSATPLDALEGDFQFAAMVPYQVKASVDQLHRIEKLIIGGGPVDPTLESRLEKMANDIYHTYGMTETISHVAMRKINGKEASAAYKAMHGVRFSTDERNCLVIDAPDIGVEGLVTNDVVNLLDAESFIWKGRYDNVVNSAGLKLHPELIEKKIGSLGLEYFLIGMPDEKFGEKLVMLVESEEEFDPIDFPNAFQSLDPYQKPKEILSAPKFLRTSNGKVKRKATLQKILKRNS